MLNVGAWNINPNTRWFVRLAAGATGIGVELYLSSEDAAVRQNLQASGESSAFGSDRQVTLSNAPGATEPVSSYESTSSWHLKVSGAQGDPVRLLRVGEFVEGDEITHAIFRSPSIQAARAAAEIDLHTHAVYRRSVSLASPLPLLAEGQIGTLSIQRLGLANELVQLERLTISGTPSRLTMQAELLTYKQVKR